MNDAELAALIREHAYLEGDFLLRSGKRSRYYLDKYRFETRPNLLGPIGERLGARLGNNPTSDELVTKERKLKLIELESRQKLWRWLIVAVLGLLAVETLVAGRLARRDLSTRDVQQ